ncbi:MAG TPA: hypothetical protein PLE32_23895 [Haliscomenobacter sp.]|nr:hypothetical protein [Haliscomenobacter sp.]
MARPNNGGWDFIKVGGSYQYYEAGAVFMVTVLQDLSTPSLYEFLIRIDKAERDLGPTDSSPQVKISHDKKDGVYGGMSQFFETERYKREYTWIRKVD